MQNIFMYQTPQRYNIFLLQKTANMVNLDMLNQAYRDYSLCYDVSEELSSYNIFKNELFEEEKTIYSSNVTPALDVVATLKDKYNMLDFQIDVFNPFGVDIIRISQIPNYLKCTTSIMIPIVKKNLEIIDKELANNGYYRIRQKQYTDNLGRDWLFAIYDPVKQESITEMIMTSGRNIYHCSPSYNFANIKSNGLLPRNDKRIYEYLDNRVYLYIGDINDAECVKMLYNVNENRKRLNKHFDGICQIYVMTPYSLPEDIELYQDPHGKNCVYTTAKIPTDSFTSILNVRINADGIQILSRVSMREYFRTLYNTLK